MALTLTVSTLSGCFPLRRLAKSVPETTNSLSETTETITKSKYSAFAS